MGLKFFCVSALAVTLSLAVSGPALAQVGVNPRLAFFVFLASLPSAMIAVGFCLFFALRSGGLAGLAMAVACSIPLWIVALNLSLSGRAPMINDITTDVNDPPSFVLSHESTAASDASLASTKKDGNLDYPSEFLQVMSESYADVQSRHLEIAPEEAYQKALGLARELDFVVDHQTTEMLTFQGHDTSGAFRFVDDFVVRVRRDQKNSDGSIVDMRSRSRLGKGDFGTNARRIRDFLGRM